MKKVFITGGHLTPALAVARQLHERNWLIYYLGRYHALEADTVISQEAKLVPKAGYQFLAINAGRLQRRFTRYTLLSLFKIPCGFLQAWYFLIKYRPQVILSFGGYVALPVVLAGWLWGIPTVTHEQTLKIGLANKIISLLATKICIAWPEMSQSFPAQKTIFTGNPLRQEIFKIDKKLILKKTKPVIYITGGNLGAHSVNRIIETILPKLLKDYIVIHQCGSTREYRDYERLCQLRESLPINLKQGYFLFEYIDDDLIGWVLQSANLIISRSGANIISEIIALTKLAILIPLPWSGEGEQLANALFLHHRQAAVMVRQQGLSAEKLLNTIETTLKNKTNLVKQLKKLENYFVADAAEKIAEVIAATTKG